MKAGQHRVVGRVVEDRRAGAAVGAYVKTVFVYLITCHQIRVTCLQVFGEERQTCVKNLAGEREGSLELVVHYRKALIGPSASCLRRVLRECIFCASRSLRTALTAHVTHSSEHLDSL